MADAEAAFTEKSAEACDASATYISALDRYGDVLTQTATTVGDVKEVGADLAQPREDALAGAEAAVAAQQAVIEAEQELAQAKAELKAAKSSGSAPPSTPADEAGAGPTPLAPAGSVDRVREAESELSTAQQGSRMQPR